MADLNIEAREWARVARQKHEHYTRNVEPHWRTNPAAAFHHEQGLVRYVPHLVEQIETLLGELDRLRLVVDAARQAVNTDRVDDWNELVDAVTRYDAEAMARG